jgi:hypothetical protein
MLKKKVFVHDGFLKVASNVKFVKKSRDSVTFTNSIRTQF